MYKWFACSLFQLTIEHDPDALSRRLLLPSSQIVSSALEALADISKKKEQDRDGISSSLSSYTCSSEGSCSTSTSSEPKLLGDRDRLFRRKDEGYMSSSRSSRQLRRSRGSCNKERSSSMSRLLEG